ncbi:MAG: GTPase SAR1 family protein [Alteromonadaceae bacterium]|jgi:GTPase SAR1 family protein
MRALTLSESEQLKNFSECLVEHPQVKEIYQDFDDLRQNRTFQSDQQCMLLIGDTGVGKSHLINHYKKRSLATLNTNNQKVPVLVSRISSSRGLSSTLIQILTDLELFGAKYRGTKGHDNDLIKKVVDNLVRADVELLIINEFQELIEFKSTKERQVIANALKFVSEEAKVPIVLVGMPSSEQIAEEPQWSSRLIRRRNLEYFSLKNKRKYYLQYLMGLAKKMPFELTPKLEEPHLSIAIFSACRGENRALKHLLLEAIKMSFVKGKIELDKECFKDAYYAIYGKNKKNNPFIQEMNEIEISEVVESSRYNSNAMSQDDMLIPRVFSKPKAFKDL